MEKHSRYIIIGEYIGNGEIVPNNIKSQRSYDRLILDKNPTDLVVGKEYIISINVEAIVPSCNPHGLPDIIARMTRFTEV